MHRGVVTWKSGLLTVDAKHPFGNIKVNHQPRAVHNRCHEGHTCYCWVQPALAWCGGCCADFAGLGWCIIALHRWWHEACSVQGQLGVCTQKSITNCLRAAPRCPALHGSSAHLRRSAISVRNAPSPLAHNDTSCVPVDVGAWRGRMSPCNAVGQWPRKVSPRLEPAPVGRWRQQRQPGWKCQTTQKRSPG